VPLKLGIMSTISPDEIVDLIGALKVRHDGLELRLCDANAKDLHRAPNSALFGLSLRICLDGIVAGNGR
jgi:hypothetical protein